MGQPDQRVGAISWLDLTIDNAGEIKDFYQEVVGWKSSEVSLGDYSDFGVHCPGDDEMVAGICHARGPNEGLPAVWLPYVNVEDLDQCLATCRDKGGEVVNGPRDMGGNAKMAVIKDPAGAFLALYQHG